MTSASIAADPRRHNGAAPQRQAEHHTPSGGAVDMMLKLGGVQRESRFKPGKK